MSMKGGQRPTLNPFARFAMSWGKRTIPEGALLGASNANGGRSYQAIGADVVLDLQMEDRMCGVRPTGAGQGRTSMAEVVEL